MSTNKNNIKKIVKNGDIQFCPTLFHFLFLPVFIKVPTLIKIEWYKKEKFFSKVSTLDFYMGTDMDKFEKLPLKIITKTQ